MTPEIVSDVLSAASECLLPGLVRQCGVYMARWLDKSCVCDVLRLARLYELPRLENECYQYIADHFETV